MITPVEKLIARLDGVRKIGAGRWLARCPSHDDKRPSLSIQERPDGALLINCFAHCDTSDVLGAVEMSFADLFPDKPDKHMRRGGHKPTFSAREVLKVLDVESTIVMVLASDVAAGKPVSEADTDRLLIARQRISRVREVCRV